MGLGEGIHLFHEAAKMPFPEMARHDALVFLLYPVGGVLGLVSILLLMLCKGILRRHRFAFSLVTAGIVAGICAADKFLYRSAQSKPRMKNKCPSWRGEATVRPRCQGRRGYGVHQFVSDLE